MTKYQLHECKDIVILTKTVRIEISIQLEMQGFSVGIDSCLFRSQPKDGNDEKRWVNIIGAEKRMSETMKINGYKVEADYDDLVQTFFRSQFMSEDLGTLQ